VKTIAYAIHSYAGTLSAEELSHDTALVLTSQLFLLCGTVIIVRALNHHLLLVYKIHLYHVKIGRSKGNSNNNHIDRNNDNGIDNESINWPYKSHGYRFQALTLVIRLNIVIWSSTGVAAICVETYSVDKSMSASTSISTSAVEWNEEDCFQLLQHNTSA